MPEESDLFVQGAVPPRTVDPVVARWSGDGRIGGAAWFYGTVRADPLPEGTVRAIEYSAYLPMAEEALEAIIMETGALPGVLDVFVRHALGVVGVGEIAIVVGVAGEHRTEVFAGLSRTVDAIKERVPIYGKELTETEDYRWKVNR